MDNLQQALILESEKTIKKLDALLEHYTNFLVSQTGRPKEVILAEIQKDVQDVQTIKKNIKIEIEKLTVPIPENYGYRERQGFDDEQSGWTIEGGKEAYYKDLSDWQEKYGADYRGKKF